MAVQSQTTVLKYSSPQTGQQQCYTLSANQTVTIGRDPACQLALDATQYKGVSRRHAELSPVASSNGQIQWQIRDLGSSNGIFVNGQRLQGMQTLRSGDRLALGRNGIEFLFESLLQQMPLQPAPTVHNQANDTQYEYSPGSTPPPLAPSAQTGSNSGRIALGLAAVAVIFFVLNRPPSQQQAQTPAPAPAPTQPAPTQPAPTQPAPTQPAQPPAPANPSEVEFQGAEPFTQYFKILGEQIAGDVSFKTSDGQDITGYAYVITIEAQSNFSSSEAAFTVRFFDASGSEIGEPVPVLYKPSRDQWSQGTQGAAYFQWPPDGSNLKVVRFSR
jgi:pSer/pThr/pTyr-binding forkhead associated (FHA) protein